MTFALSFLLFCFGFWQLCVNFLRLPEKMASPWPVHGRSGLENMEMAIYWAFIIFIPLLSAVLAWGIERFRGRRSESDAEQAPPSGTTNWMTRVLFWAVLPAIIFLTHPGPSAQQPLEYLDAGIRLSTANQYLHGKQPYKDIFFDYGPGMEVVQPLLAFKLFGTTVAAHRRLDRLVDPLGWVTLYLLALVVLRRKAVVLFFVLILTGRPDIWISPRSTFPFISLALIAATFHSLPIKVNRILLGTAGFCGAAAFFYSMEGGILLGGTVGGFALFQFFKGRWNGIDIAALGAGAGLLLIGMVCWLGPRAIQEIPGQTMQMIHILKEAYGKPTQPLVATGMEWIKHPLIPFNTAGGALQRWWFPVIFYAASLALFWKSVFNKKTFSSHMLLILLSGVFFFQVALGRSDFEHWLKGTPTFWLAVVVGIDVLLQTEGLNRKWGPLAGLIFLFTFSAARISPSLIIDRLSPKSFSPLPTLLTEPLERVGALALSEKEETSTRNIVQKLRRYAGSGGQAYLFHDFCLFYFLADVVNPTRYTVPSWITGAMNEEVIRNLEDKAPPCIMAVEERGRLAASPFNQPVADYISAHYQKIDQWDNFVFLVPKS